MDSPKLCTCCGATHTPEAFAALPLPANGRGETVSGGLRMLWRNCHCGSTLAVVLEDLEMAEAA